MGGLGQLTQRFQFKQTDRSVFRGQRSSLTPPAVWVEVQLKPSCVGTVSFKELYFKLL